MFNKNLHRLNNTISRAEFLKLAFKGGGVYALAQFLNACGVQEPPFPTATREAFLASLTPEQRAAVTAALNPTGTLQRTATDTPKPTQTYTETPASTEVVIKPRQLPDLARRKGVDFATFLTYWDVGDVLPGREKAKELGLEIGTRLQLGAGEFASGKLFKNFPWKNVLDDWSDIQESFASGQVLLSDRLDKEIINRIHTMIDFAVANGLDSNVSIGNIIGSAGDKLLDTGLLGTKNSSEEYWRILEFITKTKTLILKNINQERDVLGKDGRITEVIAVAEAIGPSGLLWGTPKVNSGLYSLLSGLDPAKVENGDLHIPFQTVKDVTARVFTWAREVDPTNTIKLSIAEDYIWCMSNDNDKGVYGAIWEKFFQLVSDSIASGVPVDSVVEEGTGWVYAIPSYDHVVSRMKAITNLSLSIGDAQYTCAMNDEFPGWKKRPMVDEKADPPQSQTQYFLNMLRAHVDVANGNGFGTYGPMAMGKNSYPEASHKNANAHFYDEKGNPNPVLQATIDYLQTLPDKSTSSFHFPKIEFTRA